VPTILSSHSHKYNNKQWLCVSWFSAYWPLYLELPVEEGHFISQTCQDGTHFVPTYSLCTISWNVYIQQLHSARTSTNCLLRTLTSRRPLVLKHRKLLVLTLCILILLWNPVDSARKSAARIFKNKFANKYNDKYNTMSINEINRNRLVGNFYIGTSDSSIRRRRRIMIITVCCAIHRAETRIVNEITPLHELYKFELLLIGRNILYTTRLFWRDHNMPGAKQ